MRNWIILAVVSAAGLGGLWGIAQGPVAGNDEAGLRKTMESYIAALQGADLTALSSLWATDAEYTDETGKCIKGRDAISNMCKASINDYKDGKVTGKIDNIRFLTPDVAVVEGAVLFTPKDGVVDRNRFSAVWTRKDGRWLLASARDLPDLDGELADRAIEELKWLVGDWTASKGDTTIKLTTRPTLGNKFLKMEFAIKSAKEEFTVVQMLGFDPTQGVVRSWTFDSRGGFGQGSWTRTASVWQGETDGVLPSGQVATAVTYLRMNGPDAFVWQATEREVEGQPIPDSETKYTRVGAGR